MTTITFRSPVTRPLYPPRTGPRIADEFYVTQRFDDPDAYQANRPNPPDPLPTHRATDIGNGRCGYPIVAMAPGIAQRIKDNATALGAATDALGIRIDHGYGIWTEYWHLASQTVTTGATVAAGQEIGKLGNTGLGAVCHCHIEAKRNGVRFDPEPLMFGGSVSLEDDMQLKGRFLRHVSNREAAITTNSYFRAGVVSGDDEPLGVLPAGERFLPIAVVAGRPAGTALDATEWYAGIKTSIGLDRIEPTLGYVHSSVLPRTPDGNAVVLSPIEAADCSAQDNKLAAARTAVAGAVQALGAAERVLT